VLKAGEGLLENPGVLGGLLLKSDAESGEDDSTRAERKDVSMERPRPVREGTVGSSGKRESRSAGALADGAGVGAIDNGSHSIGVKGVATVSKEKVSNPLNVVSSFDVVENEARGSSSVDI